MTDAKPELEALAHNTANALWENGYLHHAENLPGAAEDILAALQKASEQLIAERDEAVVQRRAIEDTYAGAVAQTERVRAQRDKLDMLGRRSCELMCKLFGYDGYTVLGSAENDEDCALEILIKKAAKERDDLRQQLAQRDAEISKLKQDNAELRNDCGMPSTGSLRETLDGWKAENQALASRVETLTDGMHNLRLFVHNQRTAWGDTKFLRMMDEKLTECLSPSTESEGQL